MDLTLQFRELDSFVGNYGYREFGEVFPMFESRLKVISKEVGISPGELYVEYMNYLMKTKVK